MVFLCETIQPLAHEPVLSKEVLEYLRVKEGDCVVDCTAGMGGHAEEILKRIGPHGRLVAIDCDANAVVACKERFRHYSDAPDLVCDNYRNIIQIRHRLGLKRIDAILIDCGISSAQLEEASRGFSFQSAGPLDMRMDSSRSFRLADLLKNSAESEIADVIYQLGGEHYARRIARAIKRDMKAGRIRNTLDLAATIQSSVPASYRRGRLHPATRTFMALRIKVNDELGSLAQAVDDGISCLAEGGRMAVISFHSIEDGIVKRHFREAETKGLGTRLNRKPVRTSREEILRNPRSRSARLRVFERGSQA